MPRTATQLPVGIRVSDKLTFGQFARVFPVGAIKQALAEENKESKRHRDLPNHVVVYFVMMLALFRDVSHTEVLRCVFEGIQWLFGPKQLEITGKSGISQARTRVGWEPLRRLFHNVAVPLAGPDSKGSFYRGHRVVALDGTLFNVADTPENDQTFERPTGHGREAPNPQARMVSLVECGTHAFLRAEIGGYRESERALSKSILPHLDQGMICLADRGFMGFALFKAASATGAKLLWRVRKDFKLQPEQRLADGSFLCTIYEHTDLKRQYGMTVRIVEYRVIGAQTSEPIRLVTNWIDHKESPAEELAHLYHERWEIENTLDELKTHLNANAIALRSRTPDLVRQELYGLVMGHYAIRTIMHEAATRAQLDDDELSFTHSIQVIRRRLPMFGNFPPGGDSQGDHCGNPAAACIV